MESFLFRVMAHGKINVCFMYPEEDGWMNGWMDLVMLFAREENEYFIVVNDFVLLISYFLVIWNWENFEAAGKKQAALIKCVI